MRRVRMSATALIVASTVVILVIAGSAGYLITKDRASKLAYRAPLSLPHSGGICLPVKRYDHVALGTMMIVRGQAPVRILSVTTPLAVNARVLSQHVMKSTRMNRLFGAPWPLDEGFGVPWKHAVPAKGALLAAHSNTDLVTEIVPIDKTQRASVPSVTITYRADGQTHTVTSRYFMRVMPDEHCTGT